MAGTATTTYPVKGPGVDPDHYGVVIEHSPKRVRVVFGGEVVADSRGVQLMHETSHPPVYYFPIGDVRMDLLEPSDKSSTCPWKGEARYWSVRVGERVAEDAAWNYSEPVEGCPDISGLVAFYWHKMDAWYEEDEQVYVHPRDPYTRIDVLESSRHVEVVVDGVTVADSHRPRILFETGLPPRYYLPTIDVRMELLRPSQKQTACPYKGWAKYWSVDAGGRVHEDLAWSYPTSHPEADKVAGLVAFFNERVDLYLDGEQQERLETAWSRRRR
ncbi:MAG: DUF427 domain-containing protein [Actinomycetota bacterium]|nr:DUF427 domain-containing protein [Actinomycetota bacterium]